MVGTHLGKAVNVVNGSRLNYILMAYADHITCQKNNMSKLYVALFKNVN